MISRTLLYWVLLIIAVSTLVSGVVQLAAPGFVMGLVGAEQTSTSKHFFGIVGMFMALFGGLLWHALRLPEQPRIVFLWAGLQKLGASIAVGLGVMNHIFGAISLGIAGFDLLSGFLILVYMALRSKQRNEKWQVQSAR